MVTAVRGQWASLVRFVVGLIVVLLIVIAITFATSTGPTENQSTSIEASLKPKLSSADVVAITRTYLDQQTPELAVPDMHKRPKIDRIWAVRADEASKIDGCIPVQSSTEIVWITKGIGDYLNLRDWPWSQATRQANADTVYALTCGGPGPAGTIVIDDATGAILGVYPEGAPYFHPTGPLTSPG